MLIGAHVSTRGGIHNAVDNAVAIGAEVFQTHPTSAQQWRPLRLDDEVRQEYLRRYAGSGLRGHYLHAVYLINLATPKEQLLRQSIGSLVHYMQLAEQLDADGVVFHPGSHLGAGFDGMLEQVAGAMHEILDTVPNSPAAKQLLAAGQLSAKRPVDKVPELWVVQVLPPVAVASSVPRAPTAKQALTLGQLSPRSWLVVPEL